MQGRSDSSVHGTFASPCQVAPPHPHPQAPSLVCVISFPRAWLVSKQLPAGHPVDMVASAAARALVTAPRAQPLAKRLCTTTTTIFRAADHAIIPRSFLHRYDIMSKTIAYQDRTECASLRIAINTTEGQELRLPRRNTATAAILMTITGTGLC